MRDVKSIVSAAALMAALVVSAVPAAARQSAAAKELADFLASPRAAVVFRAKGLEPG